MRMGVAAGDLLIMLTAGFTVYLSIIMIRRIRSVVLRDGYARLFRSELAVCAVLVLAALDVRFSFLTGTGSAAVDAAGWILRALVTLASLMFLFFFVKVCAGGFIHTRAQAGYAIVLGLALENGRPAPDLLKRLDTAEQYLRRNPESRLILTGGNPDASGRTEASVMRDILVGRGVREDRLILEDQADTTIANFRNSAKLMDPGEPAVLITSGYHMDRSVQTAKRCGFSAIYRQPAPSSMLTYGANVMHEVMLEMDELKKKL